MLLLSLTTSEPSRATRSGLAVSPMLAANDDKADIRNSLRARGATCTCWAERPSTSTGARYVMIRRSVVSSAALPKPRAVALPACTVAMGAMDRSAQSAALATRVGR
jgi:hypothetical protein